MITKLAYQLSNPLRLPIARRLFFGVLGMAIFDIEVYFHSSTLSLKRTDVNWYMITCRRRDSYFNAGSGECFRYTARSES